MEELLKEAQYFQIEKLIEELENKVNDLKNYEIQYVTVRYLPGSTYDGWPIRIEGPLQKPTVAKLNGGNK